VTPAPPITLRDLSPYAGELAAEDHEWLKQISDLNPYDYRLGIGTDDPDPDDWSPIVERQADGEWWAGRFVGAITLGRRQLVIEPRLGIAVEQWIDQALGLLTPPESASHYDSPSFILRLMARLWCRSVDNATKHGLPLLRLPQRHDGQYVRGRLDVPRTGHLFGSGRQAVASITYERSLAHPATRAIVCAERALAEKLAAHDEWRTPRVREVMPHLLAGVGSRPRLPTLHEIKQVRYTPITIPFRQLALLSHRIATRLGYGVSDEPGTAEGILVDVAEAWELFVLNCARQAAPAGMRVEHGTHAGRRDSLLRSTVADKEMGSIKPDILLLEGESVVAIIDAKYKRLRNTRPRPFGVDQADLYQLASYAMRLRPRLLALLAYPHAPDEPEPPQATAEASGPWRRDNLLFEFKRLPLDVDTCREAIHARLLAGET
jgi:5-methylcytosine-specific restriction enzyme subunit McrC